MGGQNTKLTPEAEAMPPKIRPLLQRKFEEIKNRIRARRLRHDAAPSKKQLLKPEDNEEEVNTSEFQSSPENSVASSKAQTVPEKKTSNVAPVLVDHDDINDKKNKEKNKLDNSNKEQKEEEKGKVAKVVPVYIGGVFALEQATDGEEENEDQEDMRSINYQMDMYPSSPSFRVYCQEPTEFEKELEMETEKDASKYDNTCSTDEDMNQHETPSAASRIDSKADNNGQDTKPKKKARRRRRKKPFQMGGPADCSVKNLLNVRGWAGHDRAAILAEKSAPT
ncbi:uncharacterized protein LOC126794227 [Argentina anserina]|uniref:uncharacterized protein LOC126794227 n=1 Tax=Argentina anserina TaxID=57926 RepID=UPI0021766CC6|nr:uncharacterized protein LOC126794227 [Potentilla anserina]